jgi:hypothetical protein
LLQNKTNRGREKVCQVKVEGMGERGRSRAHGRRRIRADALADMADSGERFRQPGGAIGSGARGEMARRERGLNRRRGVPHLGSRVMGERATVTVTVSSGEVTAGG